RRTPDRPAARDGDSSPGHQCTPSAGASASGISLQYHGTPTRRLSTLSIAVGSDGLRPEESPLVSRRMAALEGAVVEPGTADCAVGAMERPPPVGCFPFTLHAFEVVDLCSTVGTTSYGVTVRTRRSKRP